MLRGCSLSLAFLLLAISVDDGLAHIQSENGVKTSVYSSPKLTFQPGSVVNKFFYNIDFPRGHIAIKSFNVDLVDDAGNSVPLHETYLHHWSAFKYYIRQGTEDPKYNDHYNLHQSDIIMTGSSGICKDEYTQFSLGSETRRTATKVPDPYGIEAGNLAEIPQGFDEKWILNVHAIDTRGAQDKFGCVQCRCHLYNVTIDEYGRPFKPNYDGGMFCCYNEKQCRVKQGFEASTRNLYMKYTVMWVDWDKSVVPVKLYIYDVTDRWKMSDGTNGLHDCEIEYVIQPCSGSVAKDRCVDTKRVTLTAPSSGDIIYALGHQHAGGMGIALYREDGRVLCSSIPIYGEGTEAGNEAGYVVGMSTCYPQPGSTKISKGETIVVESNYSSAQKLTGVMGFINVFVAEPESGLDSHSTSLTQEKSRIASYIWVQVMFGLVISATVAALVVFTYRQRSPQKDGYKDFVEEEKFF